MPGPKPPAIKLTAILQNILEQIARCYTNPYYMVLRAKIILIAATGANNAEVARRLDIDTDTARTWRDRWLAAELSAEVEGLAEKADSARRTAFCCQRTAIFSGHDAPAVVFKEPCI